MSDDAGSTAPPAEDRSTGPVVGSVVVVPALARSVAAYRDWLYLEVLDDTPFEPARSRALGRPELAGAPAVRLGRGPHADGWLTLVEDPRAVPAPPFRSPGWMALELCVNGIDALARELEGSPFTRAGGPASLAVSDALRAMQVVGPAGEVLYLTEVFDAVPPFELPRAQRRVDHLFVPVLAASDLGATLRWLGDAALGEAPLRFETKLTSLGAAWGLPPEQDLPVAVVPLAGACLFEVDQLPGPAPPRARRAWGIASVVCRAGAAVLARASRPARAPIGAGSVVLTGPDGVRLELVPRVRTSG